MGDGEQVLDSEILELTTTDVEAWERILDGSLFHDFYHSVDYHRLEERAGGHARMFAYYEGRDFIAIPLILRPLPAGVGEESQQDATSVYGYAGPVFSTPMAASKLGPGFRKALEVALVRHRVVTAFSRLHPLVDQRDVLEGLGEVRMVGDTVSLDLTMAPDERRRSYRANHRRDIRRLREASITCQTERSPETIAAFEQLYSETMARLNAAEQYHFESGYFRQLLSLPHAELMLCLFEDRIICAGIFLREGSTAQYHLSGTATEFYGRAPLKLMIDYAADWMGSSGVTTLHLGGGVGGRDDGLLNFKKGFSERVHQFSVWQWVVDSETYGRLAPSTDTGGFFPAYRIDTVQ
jgi:hypothetical protein